MSISNAALRNPSDDYSYEELTRILSDRELYILLERFCNQLTVAKSEYESFLQFYFNDEGYVDIWRIPHVMMDVLLHRTKFSRVFDNREFRKTFHRLPSNNKPVLSYSRSRIFASLSFNSRYEPEKSLMLFLSIKIVWPLLSNK